MTSLSRHLPCRKERSEHAYLLHQADKYEERAIRMKKTFFAAAVLAVFVSGGVPIVNYLLEKGGLPFIDNLRLLSGILGGATFIFASILLRYALTSRHYTQQLSLRLLHRSIAGYIARWMFVGEAAILIATFSVAIYLTFGDIFYLFTYIWNHTFYTLDGWEPVTRSR